MPVFSIILVIVALFIVVMNYNNLRAMKSEETNEVNLRFYDSRSERAFAIIMMLVGISFVIVGVILFAWSF